MQSCCNKFSAADSGSRLHPLQLETLASPPPITQVGTIHLAVEIFLSPSLQQKKQYKWQCLYLADRDVVPFAGGDVYLNALHQPLQLFSHIPCSSHGAELDEILIAPLHRVATLHPLKKKWRGTVLN